MLPSDNQGPFILYQIYIAIVILAVIIGNANVLFLFCCSRRLRRSPSNLLLFALAIFDISGGSSCIPFVLPLLTAPLSKDVSCNGFYFSGYGAAISSLYLLLGITVDRFTAIKWPLHHKIIVTFRKVVAYIIIIFVLSLLLVTKPLVAIRHMDWASNKTYVTTMDANVTMGANVTMDVNVTMGANVTMDASVIMGANVTHCFELVRVTTGYLKYVLMIVLPIPVIIIIAMNCYIFSKDSRPPRSLVSKDTIITKNQIIWYNLGMILLDSELQKYFL